MGLVCPNYKSVEFRNLVKHFKMAGMTNDDAVIEATRVFMAHGSEMPAVHNLSEIKKAIRFQSKGVSSLKKSKMLVSISQYNKKNNSSHNIKFKPSTPTSYVAELNLNFMPKKMTSSVPIDMNKKVGRYSNTTVNTLEDPDVYVGKSNEYIVGGEVFPSYEDAKNSMMYQKSNGNSSPAIEELNLFLKKFLSSYGINVEYVDNFMSRFKLDAVAVSDLSTKMISVAQGREDSTTLPEEASHFIIELMGKNHSLYKAMDAMIKDTTEYQKVKEEYSSIYKGDEEMIKKEAMGKILSEYIIKRHKSDKDLPIKVNNVLGKIFDWFKRTFTKMAQTELETRKEAIFSEVANNIFNNKLELKSANLMGKNSVYAQIDDVVISLNKAIEKLQRKAKILAETGSRGDNQGNAEDLSEDLDLIAKQIDNRIVNKQYAKGIATYLEYITNNDLKWSLEEIGKYMEDPESNKFSHTQINEMLDLIAMYEDTVADIKSVIAYDNKYKDLYNEKLNDGGVTLKQMLSETKTKISDVKEFAERMHDIKAAETIEQVKHEDSKYETKDLLDSAIGDLSWLQLNFGSLRNAPDEALRMIYRMVSDIYNETYYETLDRGKNLMDLQIEMEKSGISVDKIHETYDGKKTGFMISTVNYGEYHAKKYEAKEIIAKELGYDSVSDMKYSEMDSKSQKQYQKRYKELFRTKYEQNISGEWVANPPLNPEFKKLMKNESFNAYYVEMKSMMREARKMLPSKYSRGKTNELMLPQIRKDIMQTLKDKEGPLLKEIGSRMKESLIATEDDTEFGTTALENSGVMRDVNGNIAKLVPIHYVTKLGNPTQLSNDITSMTVKFYEMASNFKNVSKDVDKLLIIQRSMGKRQFEHGKKGGSGVESNAYKALDQFLESFIFGKMKDSGEWKIPGTNTVINTSKLTDRIANFVRGNNLFMNVATTISGYTKAGIDSFIDRQVDNYTSNESGWFAEKEFDLNIVDIMSNLGKRKKFGKVSLMYEYNGIFSEISETFHRLDFKSKLGRATQSDLIYSTYAVTDLRIKGKLALAVYNNYRLVDGKFITKRQFERTNKDSKAKWSDYKDKTLYDAYEVRDGKFQPKAEYAKYINATLRNTVRNIIKQRGATIDGQLTHLDRPAIQKSMMGRFIMIHRGWLVSGLAERFKSKGINYETGEMEEGYYRSFGNTFMTMLGTKGTLKQKVNMWSTLDDFQKKNTAKMILDLSFSVLVLGMAAIMNGLVDDNDEDDWWIQYLGYQMNRIRLEQLAFMSPNEVLSLLNSPTAATSLFDAIGNLGKFITDWEKIEYGSYEDMYQFQKGLIKNSLLKNLWELQDPGQKNKFLRSQVM